MRGVGERRLLGLTCPAGRAGVPSRQDVGFGCRPEPLPQGSRRAELTDAAGEGSVWESGLYIKLSFFKMSFYNFV